jgi:phosphohistidine phosphatase
MHLLLLRHGPAEPKNDWRGDDAERPLSTEGRLQVKDVAASLARQAVRPDVILTSPYVRARQTAQIFAEVHGLADVIKPDERLAPGFGARQLSKVLRNCADCKTVMLVGHEPDLSDLVRALTGGGRIAIRKAAVAHVDLPDPRDMKGRLVALIVPAALDGRTESETYNGL